MSLHAMRHLYWLNPPFSLHPLLLSIRGSRRTFHMYHPAVYLTLPAPRAGGPGSTGVRGGGGAPQVRRAVFSQIPVRPPPCSGDCWPKMITWFSIPSPKSVCIEGSYIIVGCYGPILVSANQKYSPGGLRHPPGPRGHQDSGPGGAGWAVSLCGVRQIR